MTLIKTKKKAFCSALADTHNVGLAARAIGVNRCTPYKWRKRDSVFSDAWNEALMQRPTSDQP